MHFHICQDEIQVVVQFFSVMGAHVRVLFAHFWMKLRRQRQACLSSRHVPEVRAWVAECEKITR